MCSGGLAARKDNGMLAVEGLTERLLSVDVVKRRRDQMGNSPIEGCPPSPPGTWGQLLRLVEEARRELRL